MKGFAVPIVVVMAAAAMACAPRARVSVPIGELSPVNAAPPPDAGSAWRTPAERDRATRAAIATPTRTAPRVGVHVEPLSRSSGTVSYLDFEDIAPETVNESPSAEMLRSDRGPVVLRAQVLLDRANFSVGVIDGFLGKNTELAIYWFQYSQNLPVTGALDTVTYNRLASVAGTDHIIGSVVLDREMLKGPFVTIPQNVYAQAELRCLCYSSPLEALAERFHTTEDILRKLNPKTEFSSVAVDDVIRTPSVDHPVDPEQKPIVRIHISKTGNYVQALAADGSIVLHFPSTLGSLYDPSPDGSYDVTAIARDPTFRYDPTLFSDVPDTKPRAELPPGPNSPVGTVWIALSKEHVGIHGTPTPETIGWASSHGCVRLTNWDAQRLADATSEGIPVEFVF